MNLSSLQKKEVGEVLAQLGLNPNEQKVYLGLIMHGQTTMTPLSRALGLPATTVQSIANRLHNEGLVVITKRKSRQVYEALEPKALKQSLEQKIKDVSNIIPLLESMTKGQNETTKIRIYYRERMADIFSEALETKSKLIYEIVSAKELQSILGEKFHFTRRRVANGINLKSLRVETGELKKYSRESHAKELREAKFLPRELTFTSNVLFWDNTVALFSTKAEGIACVIESKSIRIMFQQIFDLLQSVSRRMETA